MKLRISLFLVELGTLECGHILLTWNAVDYKDWARLGIRYENTLSKQVNKDGY